MPEVEPQSSALDEEHWFTRGTHVVWLGVFVGAVLMVIGVRFLVMPEAAISTFGLGSASEGPYLHYVIGLRDLWLGALAIAFALLRDWRGLFLWLLMGATVCFGDAMIVSSFGGTKEALWFHGGAGVLCLGLAFGAWRRWPKGERI